MPISRICEGLMALFLITARTDSSTDRQISLRSCSTQPLRGKCWGNSQSAAADCEFPQHFPRSGWVEHDLNEIWRSVEESVRAVIKKSAIKPSQIREIGIANQRETVGFWEGRKRVVEG